MKISTYIIVVPAVCFHVASAQMPHQTSVSDFKVVNRHISISTTGDKNAVHLDAANNDGIAWVNNINFTKGIIEFDVKGKDVMQQSFVGIAFHGANDSSFEVVYFRPFNFQSADTLRKGHSVQYVCLPKYDWSYLRETYPGKYENMLNQRVESTAWFHVKVIVDEKNIEVYVNENNKPSLVVQTLSDYLTGKIGFWVGNGSDGDFSNLIIKNK